MGVGRLEASRELKQDSGAAEESAGAGGGNQEPEEALGIGAELEWREKDRQGRSE